MKLTKTNSLHSTNITPIVLFCILISIWSVVAKSIELQDNINGIDSLSLGTKINPAGLAQEKTLISTQNSDETLQSKIQDSLSSSQSQSRSCQNGRCLFGSSSYYGNSNYPQSPPPPPLFSFLNPNYYNYDTYNQEPPMEICQEEYSYIYDSYYEVCYPVYDNNVW